MGSDPISGLDWHFCVKKVPILDICQIRNQNEIGAKNKYITIDIEASTLTYAIYMPDDSMEPALPKGAILIVDPQRTPQYKSFVLVSLNNHPEVVVRQYIKNMNHTYIKPISHLFENTAMTKLTKLDTICGVVIEVRFQYHETN